jgi:hypothetical protein
VQNVTNHLVHFLFWRVMSTRKRMSVPMLVLDKTEGATCSRGVYPTWGVSSDMLGVTLLEAVQVPLPSPSPPPPICSIQLQPPPVYSTTPTITTLDSPNAAMTMVAPPPQKRVSSVLRAAPCCSLQSLAPQKQPLLDGASVASGTSHLSSKKPPSVQGRRRGSSGSTSRQSRILSFVPSDHRTQLKRVLGKCRVECKKRDTNLTMRGAFVSGNKRSATDRLLVLNQLRERKQPEQRTDEWYAQRDRLITASDFGSLLHAESTRTNYALDKAKAIRNPRSAAERRTTRPVGAACRHGILFEPVCDLVYRTVCRPGAHTSEFGLLVHPEPALAFLGASPDGICTEHGSEPSTQTGRLVEYKAPISRKIVHGRVPEKYLAQMQGQLEVTGLCECDYLECAFRVQTREEALRGSHDASDGARADDSRQHALQGVLLEFPACCDHEPVLGDIGRVDDAHVLEMLDALGQDALRQAAFVRYWVLDDYQLVTVVRNQTYFRQHMLPHLQDTWAKIRCFATNDTAFSDATRARADRAQNRAQK